MTKKTSWDRRNCRDRSLCKLDDKDADDAETGAQQWIEENEELVSERTN